MLNQDRTGMAPAELSPGLALAVSALERACTALDSAWDAAEAAERVLPNSTDEDMARAVLWGQRAALQAESNAVHRALVALGAREQC